jgi:hypothetical protein
MLWHRRRQQSTSHLWLRDAIAASAKLAFS